jgi:hypothetical protein
MTLLTAEQQLFWDALRGAPYHAHTMAQDIMSVKGRAKRFHQRIDKHLGTVMCIYNDDEVIRIVHTWLTVYQMPLNPERLSTFDLFHDRYGTRVLALMGRKIKPY